MSEPGDGALVIGLGNRLRGDDGAGPRVAELVAERAPELDVIVCEREPSDLLLRWDGARVAVIVDAVAGPTPGTVHRLELDHEELAERPGPTASTHALDLSEVVELGASSAACRSDWSSSESRRRASRPVAGSRLRSASASARSPTP